jgi:hypothetical protein
MGREGRGGCSLKKRFVTGHAYQASRNGFGNAYPLYRLWRQLAAEADSLLSAFGGIAEAKP